jgi:hypothetical protein
MQKPQLSEVKDLRVFSKKKTAKSNGLFEGSTVEIVNISSQLELIQGPVIRPDH